MSVFLEKPSPTTLAPQPNWETAASCSTATVFCRMLSVCLFNSSCCFIRRLEKDFAAAALLALFLVASECFAHLESDMFGHVMDTECDMDQLRDLENGD